MSNPWFRLYTEMVDDPKIRLLAFEDRWHFVAILCCKGKGLLDKGDARDLMMKKLSLTLGLSVPATEDMLMRLADYGLVDTKTAQPTKWDDRQFQSDSSYERVKRYREKRAASGLVQQVQIPKAVRQAVFENDEYSCVYCQSSQDLTIDHKVPESRGGSHTADNLCTACRACNAKKRDLTQQEFLARYNETLQKRSKNTDTEEETEKSLLAPSDDGRVSRFEEFWKAYPVKKGRAKAEAAWKRQKLDRLADVILDDVVRRGREDGQWLGGFIPHGSTYVNGKGWNDAIIPPKAQVNGYHSVPRPNAQPMHLPELTGED